ncbi:MAG: hypothetical protein U0790_01080 [Isosphaeraceae bacterium]
MVPGLLEEVEYSDEDIEDRGTIRVRGGQPERHRFALEVLTCRRLPPTWPTSIEAPGWTGSTDAG